MQQQRDVTSIFWHLIAVFFFPEGSHCPDGVRFPGMLLNSFLAGKEKAKYQIRWFAQRRNIYVLFQKKGEKRRIIQRITCAHAYYPHTCTKGPFRVAELGERGNKYLQVPPL